MRPAPWTFWRAARIFEGRRGVLRPESGATLGTLILALEPRFKAGILIGGGMAGDNVIPEVDLLNFAPRVLAPTLMLNGRYDFVYPPGTSQLPLFRLLGTPEGQKRHVQFDSGHMPPIQDVDARNPGLAGP